MEREIKIPYTDPNKEVRFVGRNGEFNQHGISLFLINDGVLLIEALRKNGKTARCLQSIPHADIPALIAALQALYAAHAPKPSKSFEMSPVSTFIGALHTGPDGVDRFVTAPTPVPDTPEPERDGSNQADAHLIIEEARGYTTRNGKVAWIAAEVSDKFYKFIGRIDGTYESWTQHGFVIGRGDPHEHDLMKESEYTPDTKIVPHNEDLPHTEPKEWSEDDYEDDPLDL